ncbi:MAG: type II glyceraldehyde-3-phosphate dehydrogenase, partial [Nitrososphaeraceae archaeon]
MVKVFINGYGNIGRRLATSLSADKEIQFIGNAKYTADDRTKEALENNFDVYVQNEMVGQFKEKGYNT